MKSLLFMALVWLIASLIVIPWFFIASLPLFFVLIIPFVVALGAFLGLSWALAEKPMPEARPSRFEIRAKEAFRIFVPDIPRLQEQRESLEAMLAQHQKRLADKVRACACMLQERTKVLLTVRLCQDRRYSSHQVRGLSPQDAIRRMDWKLSRSLSRPPGQEREFKTPFCSRPWCCNAAHCPYRDARFVAAETPALQPA